MQCNTYKAISFLWNHLLKPTRQLTSRTIVTASAHRLQTEETAPFTGDSKDSRISRTGSPAKLSRAACQAVRISCNNGHMRDAFYIVNSLRYNLSASKEEKAQKLSGLRNSSVDFDPIDFSQPVNSRLSCHALLHGLLRQGLSTKASQLAGLMMQDGMKLRSATLEALTGALCKEASATQRVRNFIPVGIQRSISPQDSALTLNPGLVNNEHLSEAIRLLRHAKQYRQRRTENMFERLINACLLQGEILVGSLLFVLLVKDWERRRNLALRLATARSQGKDLSDTMVAEHEHLQVESILPRPSLMNKILHCIDFTFSQDSADPESVRLSLQALASLASLLDNRQLSFPEVSTLLRTMYRCPRVDNTVWISQGRAGHPQEVNAYRYFHAVMKRLIMDLPSMPAKNIRFSSDKATTPKLLDHSHYKTMLPALDLPSYNSLLHYVLRHRLSLTLANRILQHMMEERHKPLKPDIVTYNTLLRSGTLLRKNSFAERILDTLRGRKENSRHPIMISPPKTEIRLEQTTVKGHQTTESTTPLQLSKTEVELLSQMYTPGPGSLPADEYTLSSYISHLVSTGRPDAVTSVLFYILPELDLIDHPSNGHRKTSDEKKDGESLDRSKRIDLLISYGPYFFTNILNALRKDGRTGLAERVWLFAKKVERASWNTANGWCLPTAAYTIMIQCYCEEARRSTSRHNMHELAQSLTTGKKWEPKAKQKVIGWARFARNARDHYDHDRGAVGRYMGLLLFRSMTNVAVDIYKALMKISKGKEFSYNHLNIPQPDARFFNAALGLCTIRRQGRMRPRSPGHYRRRHRLANYWYMHLAHRHAQWSPELQEVCEAMVEAGFSVPLGLRYLFVGRWPEGSIPVRSERPSVDRAPYAYPRPRRIWRPHRLHTRKMRGLPLRRRPTIITVPQKSMYHSD